MKLIIELDYMPFSQIILYEIEKNIECELIPLIWNDFSYCIIDFDKDDLSDIQNIVRKYEQIIENKTIMTIDHEYIPLNCPIKDIYKLNFNKKLSPIEIKALWDEGNMIYKRLLENKP